MPIKCLYNKNHLFRVQIKKKIVMPPKSCIYDDVKFDKTPDFDVVIKPSQDEISPFSRLSGDWMVTGKVDFSRISVTIQWTEWQAHFSDLSVSIFFEKKIATKADRTRDVNVKEKAR